MAKKNIQNKLHFFSEMIRLTTVMPEHAKYPMKSLGDHYN